MLRAFEIEIDVKVLKEFSNGVAIRIPFLLNHFHQIGQNASTSFVCDHCSSKITQDVRASCLNGIEVSTRENITLF